MKKIAIFHEDLSVGGIQKSIINLLNNLDYSKVSVDLYLLEDNNFYKKELVKKVKIKHLKALPKIFKYLPFSFSKILYKSKIEKEYDLAIDFSSYRPETALGALQVKAKRRYIFCHDQVKERMKHEAKYNYLMRINKNKYRYFDDIIAVSKNSLSEINDFLDRRGGFVLANLIDEKEILARACEKSPFKIDKNKYNLVAMGRFTHAKGFDLLVDLISSLKRDDLVLSIIGGGEDFKKIKKLIAQKNLNERIVLLGYLDNPYSYMNQADAFISSSRYEGQGIAILEAYLLGLEMFIPKHLEKSQDLVKGRSDLKKALEEAKKSPKKIRTLKDYNKSVLTEFYEIIKK